MLRTRTMRLVLALTLTLLVLPLATGARSRSDHIRATLDDGQVLYGAVKTPRLALDGALGELRIPLEDIGEVVPVEGEGLDASEGHVRVWLRDGSELVGRWLEPEIAMGIRVGKDTVRVELPAEQLTRLQTQGGEVWNSGVVYRVRTVHGDDFLVDARASRFTLHNRLGEFSPTLADCVSVRPIDDPEGDWRVELTTGTVLVGALANNQLTLVPGLGPDEVTVPLASFASMEQQTWAAADRGGLQIDTTSTRSRRGVGHNKGGGAAYQGWDDAAPADVSPPTLGVDAVAAPGPDHAALEEDEAVRADGWFTRHSLERAKSDAD